MWTDSSSIRLIIVLTQREHQYAIMFTKHIVIYTWKNLQVLHNTNLDIHELLQDLWDYERSFFEREREREREII